MSRFTSAPLTLLLTCSWIIAVSGEPVVIRVVQVGQDVILPCQTGDVTIRAAEWTRSDLVAPDYVLFYRDGRSDPTHQHSSFTGRVYLMDDQLKTGNVSLILKNVSREDVGTYECRVLTAGSRRKKTETISIIELQVTGDQKGHNKGDTNDGTFTPQRVGLAAAAAVVLLVSAAVGLLVRKYKRQRENEPEPSDVTEAGDNLL